jgi:hypothetical protein
MSKPDLKMILERIAPGAGAHNFMLWACRGEGRGCKRNGYRARSVHCNDCIPCDNNETVGDVQKRLERGDA